MKLHGILNKGQGGRRVERQVAMLAAIGVAMLGGIAVATTAQATQPDPAHKDYVCKYVGKPGVDERLQTGNNPIWVDTAATESGWFTDGQERSYVIVADTLKLDPEPSISQCPSGDYPQTITATPPTYRAGTCAAEGVFTLPEATHYSWTPSGVDSAKVYTAVADYGFVLSGQTVFGPFDLTKLAKLDPLSAACFTPPPPPPPVPDVPGISLVKSYTLPGSSDALADAGETIAYSFLVTNTGNVPLTSVAVVDMLAGVSAVSCPSTTLAVAATFTCTASYIVTTADATGAPIVNEANASGQPPTGGRVQATAFVSTPTGTPPALIAPAPTVKGVVKNAPVKAAPAPVVSPAVKTLAFTGAETVPLGLSALLALVLGAVLTVASRRQGGKEARE